MLNRTKGMREKKQEKIKQRKIHTNTYQIPYLLRIKNKLSTFSTVKDREREKHTHTPIPNQMKGKKNWENTLK